MLFMCFLSDGLQVWACRALCGRAADDLPWIGFDGLAHRQEAQAGTKSMSSEWLLLLPGGRSNATRGFIVFHCAVFTYFFFILFYHLVFHIHCILMYLVRSHRRIILFKKVNTGHFIEVSLCPLQDSSASFVVSDTSIARVVPLDALIAVLDCEDSFLESKVQPGTWCIACDRSEIDSIRT